MNSTLEIELFEEHENVNFYTLRFLNDKTEVDKFFDNFPLGCNYDEDIDILIKHIEHIGQRGALERYFRPEGKHKDNVWAIPLETANLRLYVLRISDEILILGNGGIKKSQTYNTDSHLNNCIELLQEVDCYLKTRIRKKQVSIYHKQLYGNLTFHLKSKQC